MDSVRGCGRRQLIETNVCLKNRRLVDVRGVIVLGVTGITEPVEITLGELDLSTSVPVARDSKAQKVRDVSQLTTGLSGAGGRREGIQSWGRFSVKPERGGGSAHRSGAGSRADQSRLLVRSGIVGVLAAADNEAINTIAPGMM
jgi:hypothetical protein